MAGKNGTLRALAWRVIFAFLILMRISDHALNSFIELYRKKYGVVLCKEEAVDVAGRFLKLIEVVESNKE